MSSCAVDEGLFTFAGPAAIAFAPMPVADAVDDGLEGVLGDLMLQLGADGMQVALHDTRANSSRLIFDQGLGAGSHRSVSRPGESTPTNARFETRGGAALPCAGTASALRSTFTLDGHQFISIDLQLLDSHPQAGASLAPAFSARLPLLEAYLRSWVRRDALEHRIAGMESALNNSDLGVILLGPTARILFANASAQSLLNRGRGMRRVGHTIAATELSDSFKLHLAIESVLLPAETARGASAVPVVALHRGRDMRPLLASVLPADRPASDDNDVAAILFVVDPDQDLRPLIEPACSLYGLSPVETNLTCHLTGGASLAEAATKVRIKEQTARTYLKQVFMKTGTKRQADLVRLMFSSMVRKRTGALA